MLGLTVLAALTIAGAAITLKDTIREEWWIRRLASKDPKVQKLACERLGEVGSARAIPHLFELFEEWRYVGGATFVRAQELEGADLSGHAMAAILKLASKAPREVLRGLRHQSAWVRWFCAGFFIDREVPPEGLAILAGALEDPVYQVRVSAVIALLNIGPAARPFFSRRIENDFELQQDILEYVRVDRLPRLRVLLEFVGIDGATLADLALPTIIHFAQGWRSTMSAFRESSVLIQVIQCAFRKGSVDTRIELARAIPGVGPLAGDLVPDLIEAAGDPDRRLRIRAIIALGEIGPPARGAIPVLSTAMAGSDDGMRRLAECALNLVRLEPR